MKNDLSARDDSSFDLPENPNEKPPSRAQRLATQNRVALAANSGAQPPISPSSRAPRAGSRAREMNKRIRDLVREQEEILYAAPRNLAAETPPAQNESRLRDARHTARNAEELAANASAQNASAPMPNRADLSSVSSTRSRAKCAASATSTHLPATASNDSPPRSDLNNGQPIRATLGNTTPGTPHLENHNAFTNSEKSNAENTNAENTINMEMKREKTRENAPSSSWEAIADEVTAPQNGRGRAIGSLSSASDSSASGSGAGGLATGAMRGASLRNPQSVSSAPRWLAAPNSPRAILCPHFAPATPLHEALRGEEKFDTTFGAHYLVSRDAVEIDAVFADLRPRLERVLESEIFPALSGARVEDLLFVDIETTGLSSAVPLFLIGALGLQNEARLDLFLARDLPEEGALLAAFNEVAHGKTLVTFNGKAFDWPYIEGRSRAHRLPKSEPRAHFDLLHFARRNWKHSLPDCKLQTLELYLCGRTRVDDVAGREIPRTYHEFAARHARDGSGAHLMSPILHHNALDILTMAELLCRAAENPSF